MTIESYDSIPGELDEIIEWSRRVPTRIGYFAALYSHVAKAMDAALQGTQFKYPDLVRSLNVGFFRRYAEAVDSHRKCAPATGAWTAAFEAAPDDGLIVVQHLLLGANAHINLDLAVAVAQLVPAGKLADFHPDFESVNQVLGSCVKRVMADLTRVWPLLRLVSMAGGRTPDAVIRFSLDAARDDAWREANSLALIPPRRRAAAIARLDERVAEFAGTIREPGPLFEPVLRLIRLGERGRVADIIDSVRR